MSLLEQVLLATLRTEVISATFTDEGFFFFGVLQTAPIVRNRDGSIKFENLTKSKLLQKAEFCLLIELGVEKRSKQRN